MSRYGGLTIKELKDELRKRKAKLSGKKQDLVERLDFLDRNSIQVEPEEEFHMVLPEGKHYKDIHEGMMDSLPRMTEASMDSYAAIHDAKWKDKITSLYKERFLRYVRSANQGDFVFLSSAVWAEMAKNVSYAVDVKIDVHAVIAEAQCECGAGQGPTAHCKHVGLTVLGYCKLFKDRSILTEITCTQILQTFHHTKPYKGSPLKCADLQRIREKDSLVFDPRRGGREPGLKDKARNLCINFQANKLEARPMPFLQTIPPANTHAIALDHRYFQWGPEDEFLMNEMVTHITDEEVHELEESTREQHKSAIWHEQRARRITASHYGEICKATDRKDMEKLARRLITPSSISAPAINHGIQYEAVAVAWYEDAYKVKTTEAGLFVCLDAPYLAASPDRIVDDQKLLEVKCPYTARDRQITPVSVPYLEMCDGKLSLRKTHDYYFQIQGQLLCAKREICDLCVFTFVDKKVVSVPRDDLFINEMKIKLDSFFKSHFKDMYLNKHFFKGYQQFTFA